VIIFVGLLSVMAFTAVMGIKFLESLKDLDLSDPFEVDFDDE
jgi:hypothetical protein